MEGITTAVFFIFMQRQIFSALQISWTVFMSAGCKVWKMKQHEIIALSFILSADHNMPFCPIANLK